MAEEERLDLVLGSKLLKIMQDGKMSFEIKKGKMDYLINNMKANVNVKVYGKSLLCWAKEMGNEEVIDYIKGKKGENLEISKEEAEELGEQFWDKNSELKSVSEIKELVIRGANLSVRNKYGSIFRHLNIDEINEIIKKIAKRICN